MKILTKKLTAQQMTDRGLEAYLYVHPVFTPIIALVLIVLTTTLITHPDVIASILD